MRILHYQQCVVTNLFFEVNACIASKGWVPLGQGAATAIIPQGGRTPTGLPTGNPATSPPPTKAPVTLRPEAQWKKNEQTPEKTPRHANKASSTTQTQHRHMAFACANMTYRWTGICPHAHEEW